MLNRIIRAGTMAMAMAAALLLQPAAATAGDKPLVIAAGPELGVYFPVAAALRLTVIDAKTMAEDRLSITASAGSVANIDGLRKGRYDLAIVQEDVAEDAFRGAGPFAAVGGWDGLRSVMRFHKEALVLVARRDAKIARIADLKGKRVAAGPEGSGSRPAVDRILASLGAGDTVKRIETGSDNGIRALCRGEVDAAFLVIGQPSALLIDVLPRCKTRLVPIDGPVATAISQSMPAFQPMTIPGRLYPSQPKDVKTLGVDAVLVARADVDDDAVAAMVAAVRGDLWLFRNLHPVLSPITDEDLRPDTGGLPLHSGAARAFRQAVTVF
ncbi:TAXI family TRAP transporter solute-binding subunit [Azospirillum largimobile]